MNTLKTIILSTVLLLGMELVAVPQAIAGSSALATYTLPFGLEFNKSIPQKLKNHAKFHEADSDKLAYYSLTSEGILFYVKNNVLVNLTFDDKEPRIFKQLGLKLSTGSEKQGTSESKVRAVIRQQGGAILDDDKNDKKTRIRTIFGSSSYEFTFVTHNKFGLVWVEIMESLGGF